MAGTRTHRTSVLRAVVVLSALSLLVLGIGTGSTLSGSDPAHQSGESAERLRSPLDLDGGTAVTLTFDVGYEGQRKAADALAALGLAGTFNITSAFVGKPGYLTWDDLAAMKEDGHEIGGHTRTLADLTTLSAEEATRQICDGRVRLTEAGHDVRTFSYPFGSWTPELSATVRDCGYGAARLRDGSGCPDCSAAGDFPPSNWFAMKAAAPAGGSWTLEELQGTVTRAEGESQPEGTSGNPKDPSGGGWLHIVFDDVGAAEGASVTLDTFREFATWLASRTSDDTTIVRTVQEMAGSAAVPAIAGPIDPPPKPGANALSNPGLEVMGRFGLPECWRVEGWGDRTAEYSVTSQARSGERAEQITLSNYSDGDAKLMPVLDFGGCAPGVEPGHRYSLRAWYIATGHTQFDVYYRTVKGEWLYWTSSPYFPPSGEFVQAAWTTPAVPDDAQGLSFGLNIFSEGQLIIDDYEMYDVEGAPKPSSEAGQSPRG